LWCPFILAVFIIRLAIDTSQYSRAHLIAEEC
jgi:hypothetical protein